MKGRNKRKMNRKNKGDKYIDFGSEVLRAMIVKCILFWM
jgi:hypothetical protein